MGRISDEGSSFVRRQVTVSAPMIVASMAIALLVIALAVVTTALLMRSDGVARPSNGAAASVPQKDSPTASNRIAGATVPVTVIPPSQAMIPTATPGLGWEASPTSTSVPVDTPARQSDQTVAPTSTPTTVAESDAKPTPTIAISPTADVPRTDRNTVIQIVGGATLPTGVTFRECWVKLNGGPLGGRAMTYGAGFSAEYLGNGLWRVADAVPRGQPGYISVFYNENTSALILDQVAQGC